MKKKAFIKKKKKLLNKKSQSLDSSSSSKSRLGLSFILLRARLLELWYNFHIRIRLLHDKTYERGGWYKKYSDKPYSNTIHRSAFFAFILSFALFSFLQYLAPYLNFTNPREARAGAFSVVWSTQGHFSNNGATNSNYTGATTQSPSNQINTSSVPVQLQNLPGNYGYGTGADGPLTIATTYNVSTTAVSNAINTAGGKKDGSYRSGAVDANTTTIASSAADPGATSITVASTANFAVGDEILIAKFWDGANRTRMDNRKITEINGSVFTLDAAITAQARDQAGDPIGSAVAYPVGSIIQRIPQYTDVTINSGGQLRPNSQKPLFFRVSGTLTVNSGGSINVSGMGYSVGGGPGQGSSGQTYTDNNYIETGTGGGGGGYGGAGGVGSWNGGAGGSANTTFPDFGSAGGNSWNAGGAGGGMALAFADTVNIYKDGGNPANNATILANGSAGGTTGGGGGAGGSISLTYGTATNIGTVSANGGNGGIGENGCDQDDYCWENASGGGGGGGRIKIFDTSNPTGENITANGGSVGSGYYGTTPGASGSTTSPAYTFAVPANYYSSGSLLGLRINADPSEENDTGVKAKWGTISWTATTNGGTVKFRTRGTNDNTSWPSDWDGPSGVGSNTYYTSSGSAITTAVSQFIEVEAYVESGDSGATTPALTNLTITFDGLENPTNNDIILTKTDDSALKTDDGTVVTGGVPGAWTNESSIKVNVNGLSCSGCGTSTNVRPEVEVKAVGDSFDGTGTVTADAGNDYAIVSGLSAGSDYHVRVRGVDDQGRVSGWVAYGGNAESAADFSVDQTLPSGTISINSGDAYATSTDVTLTLSASDTGGSNLSQMRFSNDGSSWSDWENYSTSKAWALTAGDATKTVFAQFRDNAGNMRGTTDTTTADFDGTLGSSVTNTGDELKLTAAATQVPINATAYNDYGIDVDTPTEIFSFPEANTIRANVQYGGDQGASDCSYVEIPAGNRVWSACNVDGSNATTTGWFDGSSVRAGVDYGGNAPFTTINWIEWIGGFAATSPENQYSKIVDRDAIGSVGFNNLSWSDDIPTGTSITAQIMASNNADASGGMALTGVSNGQSFSELQGWQNYRYLKYVFTLNTNPAQDATPTIYDITLGLSASDSIILDATPPADVANLKGYSDSGKGTEYTSGEWYTGTAPYFEWDAVPGEAGYKYYFGANASGVPATATADTNYTVSPALSSEGAKYFRVAAYDDAGNLSTNIASFTYGFDDSAPGNVTGFSAPIGEAGSSYTTLHWSAAVDNGSGIKEYILERKRYDAGDWSGPTYGSFTIDGGTLTYQDTGLEGGYRYNYRIKAKNNVDMLSADYTTVDGYTIDTNAPSSPSSVTADPCDGVDNCSNVANEGYEMKLTWSASTDTGVGVTGYKIYRALSDSIDEGDYTLVGYLDVDPPGSPVTTEYYDNDTNNDATATDATKGTVKAAATTRLNDYVTYYYRVTAMDESGNESDIVTADPLNPLIPTDENAAADQTVDVTSPAVPGDLSVNPAGIDELGGDPLTQQIDITWTASADTRTVGRTPTGNGSGIKEYQLQMAEGDANGPTEAFAAIYTGSNTVFSKDGLTEYTYYYFKVKAVDNRDNESSFSDNESARTLSSQVPKTPTSVSIQATKGDPNTDSDVGTKISVTFNGSKIKYGTNTLTGYEVYRSTTNYADSASWLSLQPVYTYTDLNIAGDTQDGQRSFTDTVTSDATTYYYKVRAVGNNPDIEPNTVYSSLSAVTPGTLYSGWDTVPDATAPDQPADVKVKDIHGNASMVRNIITWEMIAEPQRNGADDFGKYEIYRYETALGIGTATKITEKTDRGDNYHVDGLSAAAEVANKNYSYYVVALDNAGTAYKYANGTVINAYSNMSSHQDPVNINPGSVIPAVSASAASNIGVSSATVTWTTNQNTDSLVEYRVKNSSTVLAAGKDRTAMVSNHIVNLVGLAKGTTYEYRIISRNTLGNYDLTAGSTWKEFSTKDFSVSSIKITSTTTTATVKWNTPIASDSSVEYKQENSNQDSETAGDPTLVTSHEVVIKSLRPATTYVYKVRSVTSDNYIVDTQFASFTTKPYDASQFVISPNASNIAEENITATSAKIVWNTAVATSSWVDFGNSSGNYSQSAGDDGLGNVHVVELKNLTPGKTYFYKVRGKDSNDIEYTSQEYKFTAVLKPEISNLKIDITSPYTAKVTFTTNVDTESSVSFGEDGSFDQKAGTTGYLRTHTIEISDLMDGTKYSYYVEVKDKLDNIAKSQTANFETPIDKEGPAIEEVKIDILPLGESDEAAQAIISWTTSKPATTKIEYGEGVIGGRYEKSSIEDTSLNTSHTVIVKDLVPATTYHFRIVSKDKRNNITNSNDYTLVTPTKEKSILQLILKSLEETFSWVQNIGTFFKNLGQKAK